MRQHLDLSTIFHSPETDREWIKQAGIVVWKAEPPVPTPVHTSGNARGQYGRGGFR